jgi:hypothetical protein
MNLLTNPGFNDGHHYQDDIPQLCVPDGWQLRYVDGSPFPGCPTNAYRPESVVWDIGGAPEHEKGLFFLDGQYCLKVFKAFSPVCFALTQKVEGLVTGARYRFTAQVFPDIVQDYIGGKKVWGSDPWAAEARAGVSLTGVEWIPGQDPVPSATGRCGEISWSSWFNKTAGNFQYGQYGDVTVDFTAAEDTMRVWLECKAKWGYPNNAYFMDAFTLTQIDEVPSQERRYNRCYVLLPQDATMAEVVEQLEDTFTNKRTFGFSADDALLDAPALTSRTVLVPYNRFPGDLRQFADTYYPGANLIIEGDPGPAPEPEPEPQPTIRKTRGHFGPHIQAMRAGTLDFIQTVQPPICKIFGLGDVFDILARSPHTDVVFRYWLPAGDQARLRDNPDKAAAARAFVDHFRGALYDVVPRIMEQHPQKQVALYVESINEEYECNHPKNAATADFDIAFIRELASLGLPVRAVVFTAPQGNPEIAGHDLNIIAGLAYTAQEYGAILGPHPYWGADINQPAGYLMLREWQYNPARFIFWDEYLVSEGIEVEWYGGETGPCQSTDGIALNPGGGWRAPDCHDGQIDRCLYEIMRADELYAQWNATHGDRYKGGVLFTTGHGWETFQYREAIYQALATSLLERYPL